MARYSHQILFKNQLPKLHCCSRREAYRCVNPNNAGSLFFNYKKYFSIVLMAVVDADYCFITIDVGEYGNDSDSTIFRVSIRKKNFILNS